MVPSSNIATAMTTSWTIRAPVKARGPVLPGGEVVGEDAEEPERVDGDVVAGDGVVVAGVALGGGCCGGPLSWAHSMWARSSSEMRLGRTWQRGTSLVKTSLVKTSSVVGGGETAVMGGDVVDGEVPRLLGA